MVGGFDLYSVYIENYFHKIKNLLSNTIFIIFIGLLARIIVSFSLIGGLHADEEFQGLEMAYNLLYPSTKNIIPWEFLTHTRSYIVPLLFVPIVYLSSTVNLGGLVYFQLLRFFLSIIGLVFIPMSKNVFTSDDENDKWANTILCWFFALYLPFIFFSNYLGADGFGLFLLIILMFYVSNKNDLEFTKRKLFIIGLIISICLTFRLQYAIIFLPFLIQGLLKKKYFLFLGLVIGMFPLALVDYIFYGIPDITIINFFQYNVITQKNVSLVPASYWWLYIVIVPLLLLYFGLGLPIMLFNYTKGFNYSKNINIRLLALGSVLYFLFFQYLTYKEVRFLIPAIIVILYDSFQSLPLFIKYLRQSKHKKVVKAFTVILIISIPVSFIIAPYNYDLKDNIWLAQEKIRELDPNAVIGIIDPFQMTGGYFFQYSGKTNAIIYFMDQMNVTELNSTFHVINYFINDQEHANYSLLIQLKNEICKTNILIKDYTSLRPFSLDNINYQFNPNKLGVKIELWRCN